MRNFIPKLLLLFPLLLALSGCGSYQALNSGDPPRALAVLPVLNHSELPQIIAPLTRNIREKIAHSPNWDLVEEDSAEAALQITVTGFSRFALARDPGDTGRPLSYRETLQVSVEWISDSPPPWGPDPVFVVEGDQILYSQPSLLSAETQATADLADRLADKILRKLDWAGKE